MESTTISTSNSTSIQRRRVRDVHQSLNPSELDQLKKCIEGYGWLADSARRTGLHVNTIKGIISRGYGLAETVNKIRNILLT